jgi:hypothetical protein
MLFCTLYGSMQNNVAQFSLFFKLLLLLLFLFLNKKTLCMFCYFIIISAACAVGPSVNQCWAVLTFS